MDFLDLRRIALRRPRFFAIGIALVFFFVASVGSAYEDEDALIAAFVYRLATMTSWPEEETDEWPTEICIAVLGDEAVADALSDAMRSKQLHGHDVDVHSLTGVTGASECPIVYVRGPLVPDILASTAQTSTLTVGVSDQFMERGGMIQLIQESGRLRFSINRTKMSEKGIKMSSKVLRLAVSVK